MRVVYLALYQMVGINTLSQSDNEYVFEVAGNKKCNAVLTAMPNARCLHLDRKSVLIQNLMSGMLGRQKTSIANLSTQIALLQEQRRTKNPVGMYLVIEGKTEELNPKFDVRRDHEDFSFCFDALDAEKIRTEFRPQTQGIITALLASMKPDADSTIKFYGDVSFLLNTSNDQPIYSVTMTAGNIRMSMSSPLERQLCL